MADYVKLREFDDALAKDIAWTNDIKMAAAFMSKNVMSLLAYKEKDNPRNNKGEVWFGFTGGEDLKSKEIAFLSGNFMVDASTVQDMRDRLLSFVTNKNRSALMKQISST
jgi:hypothetical protein